MSQTLQKELLDSYQLEYQTTRITMKELCNKYNCSITQLIGHETWDKPNDLRALPVQIVTPSLPSKKSSKKLVTYDEQKVKTDINTFKAQIVQYGLDFMINDARYAEVKEVKDVTAMMLSVETSVIENNQVKLPESILDELVKKYNDDC